MTKHNEKSPATARSEALAWYVERMEPGFTAEQEAEFEHWFAADPVNQREYEQLDMMCSSLGAFEKAPEVLQAKAYAERYRAVAEGRAKAEMPVLITPRIYAMAAAASLVLIFSAWTFLSSQMLAPGVENYATALGERRLVELADGSTVQLNTQSVVDVAYSSDERQITLHRGQASFDVAHDPDRPFVVLAGDGVVTAIGTSFDVYRMGQDVRVTLLEGIVEVRQRPAPADEAEAIAVSGVYNVAELRPGEQISIAHGTGLTPVEKVDINRVSAWKSVNIDFQNTLLRDAIVEVNRYSPVKLEIADDSLADIEVSGIFKTGQPGNFIRALEIRFGVRSSQAPGNRILLEPAANGP